MPNITEYNSIPGASSEPSQGDQAWAQAGYRIGKFAEQSGREIGGAIDQIGRGAGKEIGDEIEQHNVQTEVSKGFAYLGHQQNAATQAYQAENAKHDPNDTAWRSSWVQNNIQNQLTDFQNGFGTKAGKQWAMEQSAHFTQHWNEKVQADNSADAGAAMTINLDSAKTGFSNQAYQDPSSLTAVHGAIDAGVKMITSNPNLSEEQRAAGTVIANHMHAEAAQAAVLGLGAQGKGGPQAALNMLSNPAVTDHLDGTQVETLRNKINTDQRAIELDRRQAERETKLDQQQAAMDRSSAIMNSWMDPKTGDVNPMVLTQAGGQASRLAIINDPVLRAHPTQLKFTLDMLKQATESKPAKNDPTTAADLMLRMGSQDNPTTPEQIAGAVKDGKLEVGTGMEMNSKISPTKVALMTRLNNDPILKTELSRVGSLIQAQGGQDGTNQAVVNMKAQVKVDALRTLSAAADRGENYQDYLNPASKNYLFGPDKIKQYIPTADEVASQVVQRSSATPGQAGAPAKAPESRPPLSAIFGKIFAPEGTKETDQQVISKGGT